MQRPETELLGGKGLFLDGAFSWKAGVMSRQIGQAGRQAGRRVGRQAGRRQTEWSSAGVFCRMSQQDEL